MNAISLKLNLVTRLVRLEDIGQRAEVLEGIFFMEIDIQ